MDTEVMFSQATDVWGTPQWLFDALDKEFGFTLDPCSDGTNAKCSKFYSIHDSGLLKDWGTEQVFMNPPYSECETSARVKLVVASFMQPSAVCRCTPNAL